MGDHFPHPNLLPNHLQHATASVYRGRRGRIANSCTYAEQLPQILITLRWLQLAQPCANWSQNKGKRADPRIFA